MSIATPVASDTSENTLEIGRTWLSQFALVMESGSFEEIPRLFTPAATWRDFMAFTWDASHKIGVQDVRDGLERLSADAHPTEFAIDSQQAPHPFEGTVLVFFTFRTVHRLCRGMAILVETENFWRASALLTQSEQLSDFPPLTGPNREIGKIHAVVERRQRWTDQRLEVSEFRNREPQVVILGGGHNGLNVAARLKAVGVDTLVFDQYERVGDNWRNRYDALALHSLVNNDHLPFYPFPPTWTAHTPKDKFADHLESYAKALDLNVWTGTAFLGASYDEAAERWTIRLRRADGEERTLHPRHFVIAAGLNGKPKIPQIVGLDDFRGDWIHSDEFKGAERYEGKKVLVVGAGVSGHEIIHALYEHGAQPTMLQRSATVVINSSTYHEVGFKAYSDEVGLTTEAADMVSNSLPFPAGTKVFQANTRRAAEIDRDLLSALEARGFRLDYGPDGTGPTGSHIMGRDSYQLNCGASELIADGRVALKSGVEIERITETGVEFTDGTSLDVDLIVFATGYHSLWETIKPVLGDAGKKVQKVYGLAEDGEWSEVWRRSRQPGLWFAAGFIGMSRYQSQRLALLIKAIEEGIIPVDPEKGATSAR